MLAAYEDKTAFAVCTFAYCAGPDQEPILFQGRCVGNIVPARGPPVFGWDAVFEFENGVTYAEMENEKKVCVLVAVSFEIVLADPSHLVEPDLPPW